MRMTGVAGYDSYTRMTRYLLRSSIFQGHHLGPDTARAPDHQGNLTTEGMTAGLVCECIAHDLVYLSSRPAPR